MDASLRKKIQKKFKIRGYTLKLEALEDIISFLGRFQDAEDEAFDLLLDQLQSLSRKSSIIGKELVQRVVTSLVEADEAVDERGRDGALGDVSHVRVVDAFLVPKFRYDPIRKQFYQLTGSLPIHGDAPAKAALYKDRFLLLFQRVSRHPHFSKPAFDTDFFDHGSCELAPIQSLIGQIGRRWVMGVISQLEDGHFYLEDLTASVEIDLSKAKKTTGLLSENTIVIVEGEMLLDGIFQVITCGFPPLEEREKSLKLLEGHDFFGTGALTSEESLRLAELEKKAVNDMFVVLSEIWLDSVERRLRRSWRLFLMVMRAKRWFLLCLCLWETFVLGRATLHLGHTQP